MPGVSALNERRRAVTQATAWRVVSRGGFIYLYRISPSMGITSRSD
jgi:hypothetical protein